MPEYIRVVDGAPQRVDLRQVRKTFPNVSFPASFPSEVLARFGVYPVSDPGQPSFDPETQRVSRDGYTEVSPGVWEINWVVEAIPQSEINARKDAEALDAADQLAFKILFRHENAIRQAQGQPRLTQQQFIQFLRSNL